MKRLVVFLVVITVFTLSGCKSDQTINNPSENEITTTLLYERRYLSQDDEYWYEVNNIDHVIYSISKTDNSRKVLYQAENENYLINASDIYDDKVYFLLLETESEKDEHIFAPFKICSINKDGTDFTVIFTRASLPITKDEVVMKISAYEDYLLLKTNNRTLIHYDLISQEVQIVANNVTMFGAHGQKIVYISDWSFYETDMELKDKKVLLQETTNEDKEGEKGLISLVIFVGDELFFCQRDPYGIYHYNNGEKRLITEIDINDEASLFVHEEKLYFVKKGAETYELMKYDLENKSLTKILTCSDFYMGAKIIDGYFFYHDTNKVLKQVKL